MSLLFIIFAIELLAHFINALGAAHINNLLWTLFNYLPTSTSNAAAGQRKLQAQYLNVRRDLKATSSQDEFAKWAKLRRQHDKLLDQLDTAKKALEASRSKFDNSLTAVRLLLTKAPQFLLPVWYGKEPMFWLPHGWFPYYAEWILSFPRAPMGSVSAASWKVACASFISLLSELVVLLWTLVRGQAQPQAQKAKTAEKSPLNGTTSAVPAAREEKGKKEL